MVKFPEQVKLREKLQRKDPAKIAARTKTGLASLRKMLNGERQMSDEVKDYILKLLHKRKLRDECLDKFIDTEEE